jgi:hypothetical protein
MSSLLSDNCFDYSDLFSPPVTPMAISHELSTEIAAALLATKDRSPRELEDLKETLLTVYSTLQQLSEDARAARFKSQPTLKKFAAGS